MQIVVTISEREYLLMKTFLESGMGNDAMRKICNGTILPKGHGRLIDADELFDQTTVIDDEGNRIYEWGEVTCCEVQDFIENAPTIIEADKDGE